MHPHGQLWAEVYALCADGLAFARGRRPGGASATARLAAPLPAAGHKRADGSIKRGRESGSDGGRGKGGKRKGQEAKEKHGGDVRTALMAAAAEVATGPGPGPAAAAPAGAAAGTAAGGGGRWVHVPQ